MGIRGTGPFFSKAAAATLAVAASGCGPGARIGPMRDFAFCVEDLTLSVAERVRPIKTLWDRDATVGSGILSARAELFLRDRRLFRAEVSHSVAGELARIVLNEDGFLFVNWREKKAFKGEIRPLLETKLSDTGLGPDYFVPRKLFFPDLEPVSGERGVLVYGKTTYTVEFWTRGRLWPVRAVTVDDWSHAPTRAVLYTDDGRTAADIRWRKFKYMKGYDCVVADEVVVRLPLAGRKFRFTLKDPRYNVEINERRAYRLRPPPGVEVEEIRAGETEREGSPSAP